jgi:hypothetical protein
VVLEHLEWSFERCFGDGVHLTDLALLMDKY